MITRRTFLGAAAVIGAGAAMVSLDPFGALVRPAHAQQLSPQALKELMEPGPLGDMALGPENAPVTIIEYASLTCSHCATFHNSTYPHLKARYIEAGKVRYVLREFPLDEVAEGASKLARCAGAEKYFPFVETLFKEQAKWAFVRNPVPPLFALARQVGFNEQTFEKCLSDQKLSDGLEQMRRRAAERFGVNSTPTFFINGSIYRGALTVQELDRQIEAHLKS